MQSEKKKRQIMYRAKDGSQLFMGNNASKNISGAPSLKYSKEKVMNLEFYTWKILFKNEGEMKTLRHTKA